MRIHWAKVRKRQNDHFPTISFLCAKLMLPIKSKNNMSYGYVKNRFFSQDAPKYVENDTFRAYLGPYVPKYGS